MARGLRDFLGGAIQGFGGTFFPQLEQQRQQHMQNQQQQQQKSALNSALSQAQKIYADPNLTPEQKQIGLYQTLSARPEIAQALGKQMQNIQKSSQDQQILNKTFGGKNISGNVAPGDQQAAPSVGGSSGLSDQQIAEITAVNPTLGNSLLRMKDVSLRESREEKKSKERKEENLRKETLPIRQEVSEKAEVSRRGIENKERLIDLIEKGDINDPTFATLAEAFPLNLGKRLLSEDTVEYKAGLIDEFGDLRKLFQGQTRVKEIDLLEQKIADLYLTDDQKKAILKSRINTLKADLIREEAAEELEQEGRPYGVLQFRKEVEKRAKPKLEALFHRVLDEQKAIIQDAENRKKSPLDSSDPEDRKIAEQIMKEAGGDRQKARALAKKKGYTF